MVDFDISIAIDEEEKEPTTELAALLINEAISTLMAGIKANRILEDEIMSWAWLFWDQDNYEPFSFNHSCLLLGLRPEMVTFRIKKVILKFTGGYPPLSFFTEKKYGPIIRKNNLCAPAEAPKGVCSTAHPKKVRLPGPKHENAVPVAPQMEGLSTA